MIFLFENVFHLNVIITERQVIGVDAILVTERGDVWLMYLGLGVVDHIILDVIDHAAVQGGRWCSYAGMSGCVDTR